MADARSAAAVAPPRNPSPQIAVFRERRLTLTLWVIFSIGFIVQGLATGAYFLWFSDPMPYELRLTVIGLAGALVLVGVYFGTLALGRLRDPEPPIRIGPEGLHDRSLSRRPIPWSAVLDLQVAFARGSFVAFEIAGPAVEAAGVYPRKRAEAVLNRALGYPGYTVLMLGTDATVERLAEAIRPHAAIAG